MAPVRCPSCSRSVSIVGWATAPARPRSRWTRRLGRVARPGARPRAAERAAQSRAGGWGSKSGGREEQARSSSECKFLSEISVASSGLKGRGSGVGPCSLFCHFCRAALLRISVRRLMGHRPLPPHTRAVSVRSVPASGSQTRSHFPSPGHGPELSVFLE